MCDTTNPGIIYASGSGYGSDSPYRHLPGQDLLIQALSGLAANTGQRRPGTDGCRRGRGRPAQRQPLAMGILGALVHRERTGEGERVEVTLMQGALDLQTEPVVYHLNGATRAPHSQLADTFHAAPYGLYETSDGHLAISMTPIATLSASRSVDPEPAAVPRPSRGLSRSATKSVASSTPSSARGRTAEWVNPLRESAIWCAPVNELAATFDDEAVLYLDPVIEFEHPERGYGPRAAAPGALRVGTAGLTRRPPVCWRAHSRGARGGGVHAPRRSPRSRRETGRVSSGTMRAVVLEAPQASCASRRCPFPEPHPGEVLVKVAGCGVCHTDLHVIKGEVAFPMPCVLGHEISGTVAAVPAGTDAPPVGSSVVGAFIMPCGTCRFCAPGATTSASASSR